MYKQLIMDFSPKLTTESECIAEAKLGNTKAFDKLWYMHRDRLALHCRRLTCCDSDADEMLQQTMIKAWNGLPKFKGNSRLYTWLHKIAWTSTVNWSKKVYKREEISCDFLETNFEQHNTFFDIVDSVENAIANKRLGKEINLAVAKLADEHRIVFTLHQIDGLTHKQIAIKIGVPCGTVRSRFFHAKNQLREILQNFVR